MASLRFPNGAEPGILKETSDIPGIVEPLFQGGDASVELVPVMNGDDLKKGLGSL